MVAYFLQGKLCELGNWGSSQRFCVPERARSASGAQFVKVRTGQASPSDLTTKLSKLFVHLFLSHIMHTFSRCLKELFQWIEKGISHIFFHVLANSQKQKTFRSNIHGLFVVLLSLHKTDCFQIHFQHLARKIEELGNYLIDHLINHLIDHDNLKLENNNFKTNLLQCYLLFDSIHKKRNYQQSKRRVCCKDCLEDFKTAKREIKKCTKQNWISISILRNIAVN